MNKSWSLILAHPVRRCRLLMFTNTGSVSKTKHNLTYRMGQEIKLQTLFFTNYWWNLQILYFTS